MSIASRIRHVMAEKRINSVSDLQRLTGLSRTVLNKLFHDQKLEGVTLGTLHQFCQALDVPLQEVIQFDLADPSPVRTSMGARPKWLRSSGPSDQSP